MSLQSSARLPDDAILKLLEYQKTLRNELAEELIRHYEPLVRMAAHKMSRSHLSLQEDLFQVGRMTLFRLLKQFDPDLGMPFEPYAMKSIVGQMKNYLRDKSWYIQVPRRIKEKGLVVQQAIDEMTVRLERSPSVEEIAEFLEMSVEDTLEVLAGRELHHYVSLDTPVSQEENTATLGELIGSTADDFAGVDRRIDLQEAMMKLKPEERQVLLLLYEEGLSQRSAADRLQVSQMSISRIQRRAIEKLKGWLTEPGDDED
ncbi:sigma-70 family RNA polymerase sigma factor [Cohnella rhizosphaerae]|uniref:Sigma-70 family RNA polymerase sigma factor n=1 Tax=Cohnella rhizosphaerae TaxID=1457232 RepID=A0A9X4KZ16_9BACL|nr:sigma-70 family RNA polymerase sigma factor [Cohnella rhizosphaerae]MDG0810849.1 sigma-70 family RNA polymerase sigma factor [Cohnella rhizosphaerae]